LDIEVSVEDTRLRIKVFRARLVRRIW